MHVTGAHQELRFPGSDQHRRIDLRVSVDQHDATRVFGLRRTHQAPHRRGGQISDTRTGQPHRAVGQHHQGAYLAAGQPALQHVQGGVGGGVHRAHHIVTGRSALPHHNTPGISALITTVGSAKVLPGHHREHLWPVNSVELRRYWGPHHFQRLTVAAACSRRHRGVQLLGSHRASHQRAHGQDG